MSAAVRHGAARRTEAIAYRIKRDDHDVVDAVRRIAAEQFDKAIAGLDGGLELPAAVHDTRKRLKKIRGLIRLVRPAFPDYARENRILRDAGRRLSGLRDAAVLIETCDALIEAHVEQLDRSSFARFRRRLAEERDVAEEHDVAEDADSRADDVAAVRDVLSLARERTAEWFLTDTGFDAVSGGVARIYKAARQGAGYEPGEASDEELHEWRKAVKYHGHHVRLLRDIWRPQMEARRAAVDELGELLGQRQDLTVLAWRLRDGSLPEEPRRLLLGLADRGRTEIDAEARPLAQRLFADRPKALLRRWNAWWSIWQDG